MTHALVDVAMSYISTSTDVERHTLKNQFFNSVPAGEPETLANYNEAAQHRALKQGLE